MKVFERYDRDSPFDNIQKLLSTSNKQTDRAPCFQSVHPPVAFDLLANVVSRQDGSGIRDSRRRTISRLANAHAPLNFHAAIVEIREYRALSSYRRNEQVHNLFVSSAVWFTRYLACHADVRLPRRNYCRRSAAENGTRFAIRSPFPSFSGVTRASSYDHRRN